MIKPFHIALLALALLAGSSGYVTHQYLSRTALATPEPKATVVAAGAATMPLEWSFTDLHGRRIALEDPLRPYRSGISLLPLFIECHAPLDLVILMLGTNDCQRQHSLAPYDVARSMRMLAQVAQRPPVEPGMPVPEVLIVAPPVVRMPDDPDHEANFFMEGAPEKMALLATYYRRIADEIGASFFDAAKVATVTGEDGIHLDADNTRAIGLALAPVVDGLLGLPLPARGPALRISGP